MAKTRKEPENKMHIESYRGRKHVFITLFSLLMFKHIYFYSCVGLKYRDECVFKEALNDNNWKQCEAYKWSEI